MREQMNEKCLINCSERREKTKRSDTNTNSKIEAHATESNITDRTTKSAPPPNSTATRHSSHSNPIRHQYSDNTVQLPPDIRNYVYSYIIDDLAEIPMSGQLNEIVLAVKMDDHVKFTSYRHERSSAPILQGHHPANYMKVSQQWYRKINMMVWAKI
jgi:hypothetical protein